MPGPTSPPLSNVDGASTPEAIAEALSIPSSRTEGINEELGVAGINRFGTWRAQVEADFIPGLRDGRVRTQAMQEIAYNDPLMFAFTASVDLFLRGVAWEVRPNPKQPASEAKVEFLEQCRDDMAHTWEDFISECCTGLWAGFSVQEIVYKRREGFNAIRPTLSSDHDDGLIGWGKFAPRAQQTLWYWIYDDEHNLRGLRQFAHPNWKDVPIGLERCIYMRFRKDNDNPWGVPMLRGAWIPYFFLKRLRELEGVSIERDGTGIPFFKAPERYFRKNASEADKATLNAFLAMVRNMRKDAQDALYWPSNVDPETKTAEFEVGLMTSGGTRVTGIHDAITRWEQRMVTSVLADFMMLGQGEGAGGSLALGINKSLLYKQCVNSILRTIAAEVNRSVVPRLWRRNGWDPKERPMLVPGEVTEQDAVALANALSAITASGASIWPNDELLDHWLKIAKLPERSDEVKAKAAQEHDLQQAMNAGFDPYAAEEADEQPGGQAPQPGPSVNGGGPATQVTKALSPVKLSHLYAVNRLNALPRR